MSRRLTILTALAMLLGSSLGLVQRGTASAAPVGPKAYYLALGDSLGFGYQPDGDWSHGYTNDLYAHLQTVGVKSFTNLACNGETSSTFLNGGCPYWYVRKTFYLGSQMNAALSFIKNHAGQVSPVTIDMGANDMLPLINKSTCAVSSSWTSTLATVDTNFKTILSKLKTALAGKGDLVAMNYYDPFLDSCASNPQVMADLQTFNQHLAQDAAAYGVPVADVFTAFDGTTDNTCTYTWMCSSYNDIHANDTGYSAIAAAFQAAEGY